MSLRRWVAAGAFVALIVGAANAQRVTQVVNSIVATTCTNQFVRSIAATGAGTCASVAVGSDVSGLGTGVATLLAGTPSGTVGLVGTTSPTLITPELGVATATSINGVVIDNAAFTATTPVPTCQSGSGTLSSAVRTKTIGKTTVVNVTVTITAIGTCGGFFSVGLPNTAQGLTIFAGVNNSSGATVIGETSGASILVFAPTFQLAGTTGQTVSVSGVYENN
jgi:hypothetical protein